MCGIGLHKGMNTSRWGSLEATSEAGYHKRSTFLSAWGKYVNPFPLIAYEAKISFRYKGKKNNLPNKSERTVASRAELQEILK